MAWSLRVFARSSLTLLLACGVGWQAAAVEPVALPKTSAEVDSATRSAQQIVNALLDADLQTSFEPTVELTGSSSYPRHGWQKAREVYAKLQILRFANGFDKKPIPDLPVRQIAPTDVGQLVKLIHDELVELLPVFAVQPASLAALVANDTAVTEGHAYHRLTDLSFTLDRLDLPAVGPSDTFQVALAIEQQAHKLHEEITGEAPVVKEPRVRGKGPGDVLSEVRSLLGLLKDASVDNTLPMPPNGLEIPLFADIDVSSAAVLDALNILLAEIVARRQHDGEQTVTMPAPIHSMTPSDVFASLTKTQEILAATTASPQS